MIITIWINWHNMNLFKKILVFNTLVAFKNSNIELFNIG